MGADEPNAEPATTSGSEIRRMIRLRSGGSVFAFLATVGLFNSCRDLVDPALPLNAVRFSPPPVYTRWWAMTEACSGASRSFASVSWFIVPEAARIPFNNDQVEGYWSLASNQIVLAGAAQLRGGNVRHEMLHALIRSSGHERSQFLGKCAGTVDCSMHCVQDAGSAPQVPGVVQITPAGLEVGVEVEPDALGITADDGFFRVIVTARNPTSRAVAVTLPISSTGPSTSFAFDIRGTGGGKAAGKPVLDPAVTVFAPGETKRQVFDLQIGCDFTSLTLPPGRYTVRGAYGSNWVTLPPMMLP